MDLVILFAALVVILLGAELFTNGIEWFGHKLNLAEGAVGSVLAVANLIGSILVIAHDRSRVSAMSWLLGLACATVVLVTGLEALDRIAVGFLIAEAVAFGVLLLSARRPATGPSSP